MELVRGTVVATLALDLEGAAEALVFDLADDLVLRRRVLLAYDHRLLHLRLEGAHLAHRLNRNLLHLVLREQPVQHEERMLLLKLLIEALIDLSLEARGQAVPLAALEPADVELDEQVSVRVTARVNEDKA